MSDIIVIGGGIAGVSTALELSNKGEKVTLIETKRNLLEGASNNTPCRVGVGLHYIDTETAKKYLRRTIFFLRHYKDFLLELSDELSGSDYVVVKDSSHSYYDITQLHTAIIQEYKALIEEDEENKVLGEPETLIEYGPRMPKHLDDKVIATVYKTAEQILDWPRLKQHLVEKINQDPNITVITDAEVVDISDSDNTSLEDNQIQVTTSNGESYTSNLVINSTWQNVEKLNQTHQIIQSEPRTCRLKAMAEIELPEDMHDIRTSFFCFGPHCAITNTGNGRAFLTYEPETNVQQSSEMHIPDEMDFWVKHGTSLDLTGESNDHDIESKRKTKKMHGQNIITGAAKYIPAIINAKLINVSYGLVITQGGPVDIFDSEGQHYQRRESGIKPTRDLRLIENKSLKLLYGMGNAAELCDEFIPENERKIDQIKSVFDNEEHSLNLHPVQTKAAFSEVCRSFSAFFNGNNKDPEISIVESILNKNNLNQNYKEDFVNKNLGCCPGNDCRIS